MRHNKYDHLTIFVSNEFRFERNNLMYKYKYYFAHFTVFKYRVTLAIQYEVPGPILKPVNLDRRYLMQTRLKTM